MWRTQVGSRAVHGSPVGGSPIDGSPVVRGIPGGIAL